MGIRVIKTALSVIVSLYLAHWLHLLTPVSAGFLAILGIEVTRKKGIYSALQRIGASIVGLLVASLLFYVFGFEIWVAGLFVMLVFPILSRANLREGTVSSSVVMFHLYTLQTVAFDVVLNEVFLLIVGLGTATLINIIYMPKTDPQLMACKNKVEQLMSEIFQHLATHLRDSSTVWDGAELIAVKEAVEEGAALADKLQQNSLFYNGGHWPIYFYMRGEHLDSINRMVGLVAQVYDDLPEGGEVARVFEELSRDVKVHYYTGRTETILRELEKKFRKMPLPSTRGEFEVRSALVQLLLELRGYLTVSKKAKKPLPDQKNEGARG